jgi:hypothetical protein
MRTYISPWHQSISSPAYPRSWPTHRCTPSSHKKDSLEYKPISVFSSYPFCSTFPFSAEDEYSTYDVGPTPSMINAQDKQVFMLLLIMFRKIMYGIEGLLKATSNQTRPRAWRHRTTSKHTLGRTFYWSVDGVSRSHIFAGPSTEYSSPFAMSPHAKVSQTSTAHYHCHHAHISSVSAAISLLSGTNFVPFGLGIGDTPGQDVSIDATIDCIYPISRQHRRQPQLPAWRHRPCPHQTWDLFSSSLLLSSCAAWSTTTAKRSLSRRTSSASI